MLFNPINLTPYPRIGDIITYHDKQYRLVESPHLDRDWPYRGIEFNAYALCLSDAPDVYGCQLLYDICWSVYPKYIACTDDAEDNIRLKYVIDYDDIDLPNMADWRHPDKILDTNEDYDTSGLSVIWVDELKHTW